MTVTRKRQVIPTPLTVMGKTLDKVSSLDVWITKDLSWSKHVSEICIKAKELIYKRYYQHSSTDTLKQLYMSSVRPYLEYAIAVWDPDLQIRETSNICPKDESHVESNRAKWSYGRAM